MEATLPRELLESPPVTPLRHEPPARFAPGLSPPLHAASESTTRRSAPPHLMYPHHAAALAQQQLYAAHLALAQQQHAAALAAELQGLHLAPSLASPRMQGGAQGVLLKQPDTVPPPPFFLTPYTIPLVASTLGSLGELRATLEGALTATRCDFEWNVAKWKVRGGAGA